MRKPTAEMLGLNHLDAWQLEGLAVTVLGEKLTSAPGFSPSSKDLTETSDHQEGELQDLSSEPLSLAVPQLREDDSPPALRLQSLLQGLSFNVEGQTWSNSIAETKAEIERLKSASRRAEHGDVAGPSASASPAANASADEKTS
eukprot:g24635.t1